MHFNPKKSREAHPQIRLGLPAAALSISRPQNSRSRGNCDSRGFQRPSSDQGVDGRQPFDSIIAPPGRFLRPYRMIPARDLQSIFAPREPRSLPPGFSLPAPDPALGGKIGIIIMTLISAFVGAMLACGKAPF